MNDDLTFSEYKEEWRMFINDNCKEKGWFISWKLDAGFGYDDSHYEIEPTNEDSAEYDEDFPYTNLTKAFVNNDYFAMETMKFLYINNRDLYYRIKNSI